MSDRANYNRNNNDHGGTLRKRTFTAAEKVAPSSSPIVAPVEVMINSAVGNIICGLLRKWVNCGKGWRTRWFVLQEDVLSYYKVHGPDKILINQEAEKESKVIGVKSLRKISQQHRHSSSSDSDLSPQVRRKPFGEIHLKVCSIRESRSDDRKFSIFTGTKKLKLRAETGEDRVAWIQALQALKEMFLSPPISGELTPPIETVITISTEKLRQRLAEEGVSEAGIEDCEQIMKSELGALQHHLALLKQKHGHLINALQRLQVSAIPIRTLAL